VLTQSSHNWSGTPLKYHLLLEIISYAYQLLLIPVFFIRASVKGINGHYLHRDYQTIYTDLDQCFSVCADLKSIQICIINVLLTLVFQIKFQLLLYIDRLHINVWYKICNNQ